VLASLGKRRKPTNCDFSDEDIVKVFYWGVLHDRSVRWACERRHWPIYERRRKLPSGPTMSRRLRDPAVLALLQAMEQRVVAPKKPELFWIIDGKPLTIGGCSKDRDAGYGRAAGTMANGYKIHALIGSGGAIAQWRLAPMNVDERVMAEQLLRTADIQGYVTGDSNFDSNPLHKVCDERGNLQLVAARRRRGRGLGHRRHARGRLRSVLLTEGPRADGFGARLLHDRADIERRFGHLTNWGGSLTCLPPWVRTYRRVHRWVQAKLVLSTLKRSREITSYVA
jgi:hypothetical protein